MTNTLGNNSRAVMPGLIALIFAGCFVHAQQNSQPMSQQPSLEDTEKWIEQTFRNGSHIVYRSFESIDFFDGAHCYMIFTVKEQVGQNIRSSEVVNLANIDPTSIKAGELIHDTEFTTATDPNVIDSMGAVKDHPYVFVSVKTADDTDSVSARTNFTENGKSTSLDYKTHEVGFAQEGIAVEPEYAPRFVKALRHAVELCGGKASVF